MTKSLDFRDQSKQAGGGPNAGLRPAFGLSTDGPAAYGLKARRPLRQVVRTGRVGRPRPIPAAGLLIGWAIKRYAWRRVVAVTRHVVQGATA
jgi:hypothetical protein